jgi:hypothetical protein
MYTTTPNTALAPTELAERYSVENLREIVALACDAAYKAASVHEEEYYPNGGWGACGFAWMNIYGIKGNTRIGRKLKQAGVEQSWDKSFQLWNPSKYPTQNVSTLEAGARAAAEVFKRYGFEAYAGSRLD